MAIDYVRAIADGKHDAVMAMMNPEMRVLGDDKIKMLLNKQKKSIDAKGGIKTIVVDNEKVEGERAQVALKVQFGDGSSDIMNLRLAKFDGKWKVVE